LTQSSSQSEHNKTVERDYKEITKWMQDAGIVSKPRNPGFIEFFWPYVLVGALAAIYAVLKILPAREPLNNTVIQ